ncbi:MAG: transglycosylase domain-containing protein [Actinomycetota bacterium]
MSGVRGFIDRVRDERRVRRDVERFDDEKRTRLRDTFLRGERDRRRRGAPKPSLKERGWKWWSPRVAISLVSILVLFAVYVLYGPLPSEVPSLQTAFVYDRNGRLIAELRPEENRVVVPLERIPDDLQRAIIAAEDQRFYEHSGVDLGAILRAAWANVTGGTFQGGSTITQQLVKNLYVGAERTLWRKIREAILAVRYDRKFSKGEILERYLNTVYLGHGAYGVEAAAQLYFGKHAEELTLAESALFAGIVAAPERFSPRNHPVEAVARRDWVLSRMVDLGFVDAIEADAASRAPLVVQPTEPLRTRADYFIDYLRRSIISEHGVDQFYRGGLRIESTLDLDLQHHAEKVIKSVLDEPGDPQAALVAIDVKTGGILAMVGGRNFQKSQVNLATGQGGSGRQAGSAFKPFTLARALIEDVSPYEVYSAPGEITLPGGWSPSNYGGSSYGSLTLRSATIYSVNTVYAQLVLDVGPMDVAELAHRMGIVSELAPDGTITLGSSDVTPLEMAVAYSTLAAKGVRHEGTGVARMLDGKADVVEEIDPLGTRALSSDVALQVTDILVDAVSYGTGTAARLPDVEVAGKTGTTNNNADAWFCGYTTEVATCVWVGYPQGQIPMDDVHGIAVTGGSFPAEIWRLFMAELPVPEEGFEGPAASPAPTISPKPSEPEGGPSPAPSPPPSPTPTPTGGGGIVPTLIPTPPPG